MALGLGAQELGEPQRAAKRFSCGLTPLEVLERLADRRQPFLLDSADRSHPDGRYSIVGCDPWATLRAKDGSAWLEMPPKDGDSPMDHPKGHSGHRAGDRVDLGHPLEALARVQRALRSDEPPPMGLPFGGGGIGYFAYDLGRSIERLPTLTVDDLHMDDLCLGLYDWALVCDHHAASQDPSAAEPGHAEGRSGAHARCRTEGDEKAECQGTWFLVATARRPVEEDVEALLERLEGWLAPRLAAGAPSPPPAGPSELPEVLASRTFTREAYLSAVRRALEHIYAGDIYQVNLSQRFSMPAAASPLRLYGRLRERTRAMFSAFLETPSAQVLSLSPERFLKVRGQAVETCPIKGTRPRGATPEEDASLAAELTASAKDLAELSMIVDLERNDLGRVCEAGTVVVASHAELYTLRTVHHTVTRVTGALRPQVDAAALLRATFPGGSITGAPKIRSMEIIEALEPTRRGVYTGAVGFLDYSGDLDLNIAIRTVVITDGLASVQAGGGIVADSNPEAEYEETLDKARALLKGLGASIDPT